MGSEMSNESSDDLVEGEDGDVMFTISDWEDKILYVSSVGAWLYVMHKSMDAALMFFGAGIVISSVMIVLGLVFKYTGVIRLE